METPPRITHKLHTAYSCYRFLFLAYPINPHFLGIFISSDIEYFVNLVCWVQFYVVLAKLRISNFFKVIINGTHRFVDLD